MMRRIILPAAALAIALAGVPLAGQTAPARPAPARPAPARPAPAAPAFPATQALLDGYVRDGKMPGIVVAVGVGDAPTRFLAAGRIADEPTANAADADSLWRVYSMTKPVTAMAAMILVEEGKLRLDQPVAELIPAFRSMKVLTSANASLATRPAHMPITIRHLLTHTSGLSYNITATGPLLREYERLGILPAAVNGAVEADMRRRRPPTLAAFADRVATLPLVAEPGTAWNYSVGLDVMGRVIEVASGMPFDRFVQTRILDPLRMRSTYWTVPAGQAGRLATNYAFVGDTRVPLDPGGASVFLRPPSFPYGGAGLVSSARDYDRFLHMLGNGGTLDGATVMKPETARLAMSDLLPAGVRFTGIGGGDGMPAMGFGAGGSVAVADMPNGIGRGVYGWAGAAGTIGFVDPLRGLRGTIMVNYFPENKWPLRAEIVAALRRDLAAMRAR